MAAALGGMVVPAALFVLINQNTGGGALQGWAIPVATDIAFALAVLAVISAIAGGAAYLPAQPGRDRRLVGDHHHCGVLHHRPHVTPLLLAAVPLGVFTVLVQRRIRSWWLLLPLAVAVWTLVHASGVHATVAGVLLGFTVPGCAVSRRAGRRRSRSGGAI